jgi:uncharacterized OsmC-like protein
MIEVITAWKSGLNFEGHAGHYSFNISAPQPPLDKKAVSPHELLLFSLSSSCGIEVITRLQAGGHSLDKFEVKAQGNYDQESHNHLYSSIDLSFYVEGNCDHTAILNAVEYSQFLSRSVGFFLNQVVPIRWDITINGIISAEGIAHYYDLPQ